jgi:hypothetical protein
MPRRLLLPLAVLLSAAAPPAAHAASGGLGIMPSRVEAQVHRGGLTPPITVENTSDKPVVVTAQALKATADLSGQPVYDDSAAGRRTGDALLRPSPRRFVLAPGARQRVRARVLACPQQGLGTYGVMSFTATQGGAGRGARSTIQSALRLTATLLLSYAGGACLDGDITGLRGAQTGKGRLSFFLRVRNNGELHQLVRAGMAIRRGGRTVFRGPFPAENVLPESERELELALPIRLRAGGYTAVASTKLGPHASRHAWRFHLTGTNALPTPRLSIAPLQVAGLHPDDRPEVKATIRNDGSGAGDARVRFSVARLGAGLPLETKLLDAAGVAAGRDREIATHFASLPKGDYQLGAELIVGGRVVGTRRLNVEVTAPAGFVDRLRDWISAHLLATLLAFAVAAALAAALVVRRRRPRDAPAPAPAPSVPRDELAELRAKLESLEARAEESA